MPGGMSRVDEMLNQQVSCRRIENMIVTLLGKSIRIVPKHGNDICGIFLGEMRPYEWARENCLVVQVNEGETAFIKREDISYIVVVETGVITEKQIPEVHDE